jgi:hypothetical protein
MVAIGLSICHIRSRPVALFSQERHERVGFCHFCKKNDDFDLMIRF